MEKDQLIITVSGKHNAGKTTLLAALHNILLDYGFDVIVKENDPYSHKIYSTISKEIKIGKLDRNRQEIILREELKEL